MSISINIAAIKAITEKDVRYVNIFVMCNDGGVEVPRTVVDYIRKSLGDEVLETLRDGGCAQHDDEAFLYGAIEIPLYGRYEGDVMYGDGVVLQLSDLPEGTVALRIYSSC